MLKNFDEIIVKLQSSEQKTVVIAGAHSPAAIDAAIMAHEKKIARSILVGDENFIRNYFDQNSKKLVDSFDIVNTGIDLKLACEKSVQIIREKKGDLILKGKADTALLIKEVLDKEKGLRTGQILSDVLVYECSGKLKLMSDGGINLYPDIKEKVSIIHNAVKVAHSLGNQEPKVAILSAVESVNPKLPSSTDAAVIARMNKSNEIKGCLLEGPLAFDNAVDLEAAKIKGIDSPVAGDADILIMPNIESGNIFGKALTYYCNFRVAHVVMGAKVPVIIASRADSAETKMLSILLGIISS